MQGRELFLAKQAVIVMLIGLFGGFAWTFALLEEVSLSPIPIVFADSFPGEPQNWRAVHTGCLMNGIMALAIAAAMPLFNPPEPAKKRVVIGVVFAIWANTIFYFANLMAPNRSLSLGENALGGASLAGSIGYITALIGAVALIYALFVLLMQGKGKSA
ncbi:MAG: hypothetical protein ABJN35_09360 [Erythrobacter sp.]|uniref:hypothetical protein n=1 Tax=Erythrobacter sp. Alg231-14 TaxID=1922225 RepID=UPI000D551DAB